MFLVLAIKAGRKNLRNSCLIVSTLAFFKFSIGWPRKYRAVWKGRCKQAFFKFSRLMQLKSRFLPGCLMLVTLAVLFHFFHVFRIVFRSQWKFFASRASLIFKTFVTCRLWSTISVHCSMNYVHVTKKTQAQFKQPKISFANEEQSKLKKNKFNL